MKVATIRLEGERLITGLIELPMPTPSPHEVLIKVAASSLNRGELMNKHNIYGLSQDATPFGSEVAGTIIEVGNSVHRLKVGDRVMGRVRPAMAEYVCAKEYELMKIPNTLGYLEAASIPLVFTVAYDMLMEQGSLQSDDYMVITGITSGVGMACLGLGKALGAKVIGVARSDKHEEILMNAGLNHLIVCAPSELQAEIEKIIPPHSVALAVNVTGGSMFEPLLRLLKPGGQLAVVGYPDGQLDVHLDLALIHTKRLRIFGVSNTLRTEKERRDLVERMRGNVLPLWGQGLLKTYIHKVFSIQDLQNAVDCMINESHFGKIVVKL